VSAEPASPTDAIGGEALLEAAHRLGGEAADSGFRVEAVPAILERSADKRSSTSFLREWEVRKIRQIDRGIADYAKWPPIQAKFIAWKESILETARGREGRLIETVLTHTFRVRADRREKIRRLFGRQEGEE
jgi:hypothetical protein